MKKMALFFLAGIFSLLATCSWAANFKAAGEAYKRGDYKQAIEIYRGLLDDCQISAPVYYNLGNSYFRAGNIAEAVLSYRRAFRLDPRDADIRANLHLARSFVNDALVTRSGILARFDLLLERLTTDELEWLLAVLFMLMGVSGLYVVFFHVARRRVIILTALGSVFWCMVAMTTAYRIMLEKDEGVVIAAAEARFEPSHKATVYFNVMAGGEVRILRQQEDWAKIERFDGKTGWIPAGKVERL